MARVNITVPDELLDLARAADLNVSRVSASALSEELDRRARIAALDGYLRELDVELDPISRDEQQAAEHWADRMLGGSERSGSGRTTRSA